MDVEKLKALRSATGLPFSECKKALEEAKGDLDLALKKLQERAKFEAEKKGARETKEGIITCYVHSNSKLGVLVELLCETDFVAKSEEFKKLAKEIALQIAALDPKFVSPEDIPEEYLEGERRLIEEELKDIQDPQIFKKAVEGKLKTLKEEISLLSQPWIKDPSKTVQDLIQEYIAKFGENIKVGRFVRFQI